MVSRRFPCPLQCRPRSGKQFFARWKQKVSARVVADEFEVSLRTIQRLYHQFQVHGESAIEPSYHRCGQNHPHKAPDDILQKVRSLREQHPAWGAELIRLVVQPKQRGVAMPVARTLQRHLQRMGLAPAAPGRRVKESPARATRPHQVWQVDASEQMKLKTGQQVCWMRFTDEFSGAVLDTKVFDVSHIGKVSLAKLRSHARAVLSLWGRPERIRVDNGYPFGSHGDFPPELSLWMLGLHVQMIWNPPHQPQKNGVVERSQGVAKKWAEPQQCTSPRQLQVCLEKMDRIQREQYPSIDGKSRCQAYPELAHSGRSYNAAWEKRNWSYQRILDYLAGLLETRKVSPGGHVSIYNQPYYVGKHHGGQTIFVYLDPMDVSWVFASEAGNQLRTHAAKQLSCQRIKRLDVTDRRYSKRQPK